MQAKLLEIQQSKRSRVLCILGVMPGWVPKYSAWLSHDSPKYLSLCPQMRTMPRRHELCLNSTYILYQIKNCQMPESESGQILDLWTFWMIQIYCIKLILARCQNWTTPTDYVGRGFWKVLANFLKTRFSPAYGIFLWDTNFRMRPGTHLHRNVISLVISRPSSSQPWLHCYQALRYR